MKCKQNLIQFFLVIGIILAASVINNSKIGYDQGTNDRGMEVQNETQFKTLKLSTWWNNFSFIHIDGNWSTAAGYEWCSGDGSWSNPYIIENITIDATNSPINHGIFINNSKQEYFIIRNCTIYNGVNGILLQNTNNGLLSQNNCSNNNGRGIWLLENCDNNTISDNIANNNSGVGIILELNCDNNILSENTACGPSQNRGIRLTSGCVNNTILGNTIYDNNQYGIYLDMNCDGNIISGNNATENDNHGIYLATGCVRNTISGNKASNNNQNGIYLATGCVNNTISGNTINDNDECGIYLYGYCDNNVISKNTINGYLYLAYNCDNNTISKNLIDKPEFLSNRGGIYLYDFCEKNIIFGNTLISEDRLLLRIENCDGNTIMGNFLVSFYPIAGQTYFQIELYDSSGNLIYYNNIANPNAISAQAIDTTGTNKWYKGLIGNYWYWYVGEDVNGDGIGDDLRYIYPNIVYDESPIMNYKPFFSKTPDDLSYEVGTTGHTLKWIIWDISPCLLSYNILRDGTSIKSDMLFDYTSEIEISVDGLTEGTYGFTLEMDDLAGNANSDSVWVTVTDSTHSSIDVDIVAQMYSTEVFNIILFLSDDHGQGIESAIIELWWDGDQVPQDDITPLGGGKYVLSLTPITVLPGENPILLNMTITAEDCFAKYYETYLAVDPKTIDKAPPPPPPSEDGDDDDETVPEELPLVPLITVVGASVAAVCIAVIIAWKKGLIIKPKRK